MRWIINSKRNFAGPVITLVAGTAFAQAIVLVARPILTRVYSPEEFGVLTVFVTLIAIAGTITSGKYDDALMLPEGRRRAFRLGAIAGILTIVGAGIAVVVAAITLRLGLVDTLWRPVVIALPVAIACHGLAGMLELWHTRSERFALISAGRISQSGTAISIQLVAGVAGAGSAGLVGGALAGFVALATVMSFALWTDRDLFVSEKLRVWQATATRYRRFPIYSAPASLMNVLSSRLPVLALAPLFGAGPVGWFGIAIGSIALPLGMITGSVGQVFFVRAAAANRAGTLDQLTATVLRRLVQIVAGPVAVLLVAGPQLFAFVFGPEWREAGVYAQYVAIWAGLAAIAPPLTRVFDVTERQRQDLIFSVILLALQVIAVVIGIAFNDARVLILAVGVFGALGRLVHLVGIGLSANVSSVRTLGILLSAALPAIPVVIPVLAAHIFLGDSEILITSIAALTLYGIFVSRQNLTPLA
ncbi:oligosaccharide flippase family protein [soil metagenome]